MTFHKRLIILGAGALLTQLLASCANIGGSSTTGLLGGPTQLERSAQIAAEPKGSFFYGRRYYVQKTRFWGYIRKPGEPGVKSKLVMMNESSTRVPDRLKEHSGAKSYGYDNNYEYRVYGSFTGEQAYDPNSDQVLPEFRPTRFELLNTQPGWLFRPSDRYNSKAITMRPNAF